MAAVSVLAQPQTLHADADADLSEQDCGAFENFPVSLHTLSRC